MTAVSEPFDHAVVVCGDLDAAAANWRALGFTLTQRGYHTLGSQNHCIMLARDYLELLHVTAPSPSRQYYWDAQQRGDGCAAMSCKSRDAFATAALAGHRRATVAALLGVPVVQLVEALQRCRTPA